MKTFDREFKAKARLCGERCQRQMGEPNTAVWNPDCAFGDARAMRCWVSLSFSLTMCFWSSPCLCSSVCMVENDCLAPQLLPLIKKEVSQPVEDLQWVRVRELSRKWRAWKWRDVLLPSPTRHLSVGAKWALQWWVSPGSHGAGEGLEALERDICRLP